MQACITMNWNAFEMLHTKYVSLYKGAVQKKIFFSFPERPDWLRDPPSLLFSGYRDFFPRGSSGRGVKLSIHLKLVPKLRICGAIALLSLHSFMAQTGTSLPLSSQSFFDCYSDELTELAGFYVHLILWERRLIVKL